LTVVDGESDIQIVNCIAGLVDFPAEVELLEAGLEVCKCLDAFGCTSPVPDTDAIINVSGPID